MKNKSIKIILSFFITLTASSISALAQTSIIKTCLAYEPVSVNLKGKLIKKMAVNVSEQKQTIWALKLSNEICVAADSNNEINSSFSEIKEVQLVFNSAQIAKYRGLHNKPISVNGTLFAGHTQHHFTDVLLMVSSVKK